MFFYGEDRVADTLAPYITAAPTEEQSYFLATQQVDEVRHSVFFHRFFKEVIGVDGDSLQATLASTLPQLNWGYHGDLRPPRRDGRGTAQGPLAAQVRAGDHPLPPDRRGQPRPARPALHRGLLRLGRARCPASAPAWRTSPRTSSATSASASKSSPSCSPRAARAGRRTAPRWSSCCARRCPTASPSSRPPNWDREYTECYGFSLEDIFAFGLKLIRQRWRTIGFPTEEMPPGVFPFDHEMTEEEIADQPDQAAGSRRRRRARRGRAAAPRRSCSASSSTSSPAPPTPAPPTARRSSTSGASATPSPGTWSSTTARPGPSRAKRRDPNVTFETSWADWVALDPARRQPGQVDAARQHPPPRQGPRAAADAQGLPGLA